MTESHKIGDLVEVNLDGVITIVDTNKDDQTVLVQWEQKGMDYLCWIPGSELLKRLAQRLK